MRGYISIPVPGPRSRKIEPHHVPFPGFQEAFNSEWPEKPVAVIQDIKQQEIDETIRIQNRQRGECDLRGVLSDVLGLTKINFNSCLFNDRMPVTIRFANEVGDVLISAPMDGEPRLPFKFYI
jgi:hypothetical protein